MKPYNSIKDSYSKPYDYLKTPKDSSSKKQKQKKIGHAVKSTTYPTNQGASGGVMVSKLD